MVKDQHICYNSIDLKAMKKSTRFATFMFSLCFIAYGYMSHLLYAVLCGILLGAVVLFEKKMCITENGLEIRYKMLIDFCHDVWSFEDIEAIYREPIKDTGMVALNFMKGLSGKRLVFSSEDAESVIKIACGCNSSIKCDS